MGIKDYVSNLFAKADSSVESKTGGAVTGNLYDDVATSQLVTMLTRMPDLDEVLRQAGVGREKLRTLMYDDEIAQAAGTRLDALLTTPFRLEGKDSDYITTQLLNPVLRDALSGAWRSRLYGYSVLEAVYYKREDGKVGLKYLGDKPFEWFEPRPDGALMFRSDDGQGGSTGVAVDQQLKFFLTRCEATYQHPYGEALLSRLYWPWYFRTNGWKFWAKFLERFGTPLMVGKSSDPKKMVQALLMAHSQAVMGVDKDDSVEAVGVAAGTAGQAFEAFESAAIRRIQKVVLGQTLTSGTDNGSGNRALGQVHNTVREDKRNSDIQLVLPTMQKVVDALCQLNGFDKHEVVFADETGLEADRATRDKDLHAVGVRFTEEYFKDNYDLREEEFTLSSEAPGLGEPPADPKGGASGKREGRKPDAAKPATNLKAGADGAEGLPRLFTKHGAGTRFTKQQQVIEDEADAALADAGLPLDPALVRAAVLAASDPEDLESRLFALMNGTVSTEQFERTLDQALFTADVLGYVHADGKV
jgi:phage gp29-like protein